MCRNWMNSVGFLDRYSLFSKSQIECVSSWFVISTVQYKQLTVGSLSSTTCPPIFMQLTGQNNGRIACPAFLLARKSN